jgi:carboxymethylenebutenolidase
MAYSKQTVDVQGSPMDVLVFRPEGAGPFPGIVVAQHLPVAHEGLEKDPFTIDVGDKLAAKGYAAVIPFMFHWWPPETNVEVKREQWHDDKAVADLDAALAVLKGVDGVDASRPGIIGHCWGGRVSWLGACRNADYRATVTLYGGRIKLPMGDGVPAPITLAKNINGPVLGIFGKDDQNPSQADVADLDAALNEAGVKHEFHSYDGAGHGFQDFVNKERFRPDQTADAWGKVFGFLDATLKG